VPLCSRGKIHPAEGNFAGVSRTDNSTYKSAASQFPYFIAFFDWAAKKALRGISSAKQHPA